MTFDEKLEEAKDFYRQGIAYNRANNPKEAVACFEKAVEHVPGLSIASLMATLIYVNLGDFKKAKVYAQKALDYKDALKASEIEVLKKIDCISF